jgi:hypothetical protein
MMSQTQHTDTDSQKKKKFEYTPDPKITAGSGISSTAP